MQPMEWSCLPVLARSACDEAIHLASCTGMDCFAALAMTCSNTLLTNRTKAANKAALVPRSMFPPPPVGVGPVPVGVTLVVLTDQYAEADARATVPLVAELVVADHLGLHAALSARGRRGDNSGRCYSSCHGHGSHERLQDHMVSFSIEPQRAPLIRPHR